MTKTPHPQADVLRAIADGFPAERFQSYDYLGNCRKNIKSFRTLFDELLNGWDIRIKPEPPKTIRIGEFDVPEPLRSIPPGSLSMSFYSFQLCNEMHQVFSFRGLNHPRYTHMLHAGIVHMTREAADLHAKALLSFTQREGKA